MTWSNISLAEMPAFLFYMLFPKLHCYHALGCPVGESRCSHLCRSFAMDSLSHVPLLGSPIPLSERFSMPHSPDQSRHTYHSASSLMTVKLGTSSSYIPPLHSIKPKHHSFKVSRKQTRSGFHAAPHCLAFPGGNVVKNPSANAGDLRDAGSIPGSGSSLEAKTATYSSILA